MSESSSSRPYGLSFWLDLDRPRHPQLDQDATADVVVIGAGISGLKLARAFTRHDLEVIILEAGRVGDGASARNQGAITFGAGNYAEFSEKHTRETARQLWQLGLESHRMIREQIAEYDIECDYVRNGALSLVRPDAPDWEEQLEANRTDSELLREDGFDARVVDATEAQELSGSPYSMGGIAMGQAGQFHSGKFVVGLGRGVALQKGVRLFENTRVQKIETEPSGVRVRTSRARVCAAHVFLATNALAPQFVPSLERGLRAERGQVFVTEPLPERPCYCVAGTALAWWRETIEPDGRFRLLFGGGRDRDEPDSLFPQFTASGHPHPKLESEGFSPSPVHQQRLDEQFAKFFPHLKGARITHRWGGLQSFTRDDLPMIGTFDIEQRIHGIAGLSGHGNCYADVGAEFVVGKLVGVESDIEKRYGPLMDKLFEPGREAANWGEWVTVHGE